jgi:hypothetical protein
MSAMTAVVPRVGTAERGDLIFPLPTHVTLRNGVVAGVTAKVSLLADGIHLMPIVAAASSAGRRA